MEEPNGELAEPSIAQQFGCKGKKSLKKKADTVNVQEKNSTRIPNDGSDPRVKISLFDYSVENFFKTMNIIDTLCGEEDSNFDQSEIQRLSSSVTFLREWRHFCYEPRSIRFACGLGSPGGKYLNSGIKLPQFSSAAIPKEGQFGDVKSQESSKDFVLYAGGLVWALDWCPQVHLKHDNSVKCEFLAVAAHPPGASYHKMGAVLTGRGVIQIWCLLNSSDSSEEVCPTSEKRGRGHKSDGATIDKSTQIKRPRGRPRKNPTEVAVVDANCETHHTQALVAHVPETSNEFLVQDGVLENNIEVPLTSEKRKRGHKNDEATNDKSTQIKWPRGRPRKNSTEVAVFDTNCEMHYTQAFAVQVPETSNEFLVQDGVLENNIEAFPSTVKSKQGPEKNGATGDKSTQIKRPRGRPRKNSKEVAMGDPNCEIQQLQVQAVQFPEYSVEFHSADGVSSNCEEYDLHQDCSTVRKHSDKAASACTPMTETPVQRSRLKTNCRGGKFNHNRSPPLLLTQCEDNGNHQPTSSSELVPLTATCSIPEDVGLPRIVLCLAHNGKVAWDVKWRPPNVSGSICKHRMGYLALLLGNGSLEVWDVPLPRALRAIYQHGETTDPRFIKLEPVFKCSMLKRGGLESIPLTVEWSVSPPHDYLLAGCHDGTVALWKFSTNSSSKCQDTRPMLCFGGDTVPTRAVAWAPFDGNPENSNIILTAGHEGLKFWDLRDPFRPLRKLLPVPRIIYSLDWLSNPSCIIMSFEDGTMRTLSLAKAANDLPVSGKKLSGKKQPGLHASSYSSFAIWSVHISRITGMVAYCSADGTVLRFQLTTKAVETDHARSRVPHFFCGSLSEEESALTISTTTSNTPFPLKKTLDKGRHAASSFRDFVCESHLNKSLDNQTTKDTNSNPDSQALVLYNGDDLGLESGSEEASASIQRPQKQKAGGGKKKKPVDSHALVCKDDETAGTGVEGDDEMPNNGSESEAFPPKMAALHRVRWNMNKGSERWLCYGGAGGVVRCQEIVFCDIDKKWAMKR